METPLFQLSNGQQQGRSNNISLSSDDDMIDITATSGTTMPDRRNNDEEITSSQCMYHI